MFGCRGSPSDVLGRPKASGACDGALSIGGGRRCASRAGGVVPGLRLRSADQHVARGGPVVDRGCCRTGVGEHQTSTILWITATALSLIRISRCQYRTVWGRCRARCVLLIPPASCPCDPWSWCLFASQAFVCRLWRQPRAGRRQRQYGARPRPTRTWRVARACVCVCACVACVRAPAVSCGLCRQLVLPFCGWFGGAAAVVRGHLRSPRLITRP